MIYSWLSLSRPRLFRLFRITAYLELKILSLPKHENLRTGNKILRKRGEIAPKSSFPLYFQHISNFKSPITYNMLNVVVRFIFSSILKILYVEVGYLEVF